MKLFTSSWFEPLPPSILRIGISRAVPRNMAPGFRRLPALTPGSWLDLPPAEFERLYRRLLDALDAAEIVAKIDTMAAAHEAAAFVCFEAPTSPAWCHRALISLWLLDQLGLEVFEHGREACGCGAQHPKLWRG